VLHFRNGRSDLLPGHGICLRLLRRLYLRLARLVVDLDDSETDESPIAQGIAQRLQLGAVAVLHRLGKHPLDQFRCDSGNVVVRISEAAFSVHFRSASEEHRLHRLVDSR
jgi:hypothetical protein